ncbi:MAG TPA: TetR/AcrR family transcriptional regulator [Solirubrobacteraceae bacterium]|nr:TetR/AcrR family transcriptional regulator [Solirubrobacteraceae bacterium]
MAVTQTQAPGTAQRILDVAEQLVQSRGYNGFSYADIAGELGVTKASLHYHFASKAELGEALIERYSVRFTEALARIDSTTSGAGAKLDAYASLYVDVLRGDRMCLCGMLAAEYQTLPERMHDSVIRFFDHNLTWLAGVLADGQSDGELSFDGSPADAAQTVLGALQGAMLVARPYRDLARFQAAAAHTLASLSSNPAL